MTTRCIECSNIFLFKNTRGAKLSERRCACGGKLEMINGMHKIRGERPVQNDRNFIDSNGETCFYAGKNKNNDLFVFDFDARKYIQIYPVPTSMGLSI